MKMLVWAVWFGTIAWAVGSSGCGAVSCTEAAWDGPEGLEIAVVQSDGGALVSGAYEFEVVADETLFVARCDPTSEPPSNCQFLTTIGTNIDVRILVTDPKPIERFVLQITEHVDGAYSDNLSGPEQVIVTVSRNGSVVAKGETRPVYVREEPNGEGCGYVEHAEVGLTLSGQ